MRQKLLLAAFVVAAAAVVGFTYWLRPTTSAPTPFPPPVSQKVRDLLGNDAIDVMLGATRVEAFRVVSADMEDEKAKGKLPCETIGGFLITGKGSEPKADFARRLITVLLKDDTYFNNRVVACYSPGVAFRLWKGDKSVEMAICFKCRNLSVGLADTPPYPEGRSFGNSTNAVRVSLVELAKEAFPNDSEIQGMKRPYGCDDDGSP